MPFEPVVLYEDAQLLCINKPSGLLTIRDGYDPTLPYATRLLEPQFGRLWIVHRLDRGTSGVFLLARSPASHKAMNAAFAGRQVHKTYHAIIPGCPPWIEYPADFPLKIDADRRHRTLVDPVNGKPAQTRFRVLRSASEYSLLQACPLTGYTHQIRAHLLALGLSILGDDLYASLPRRDSKSASPPAVISRLALHAYQLEFLHPVTGQQMLLTAPYPDDFQDALAKLSLSS